MNQSLQIIAILAAIYSALAAMCFSMEKHYQQIFSTEPALLMQRLLYWGGWLLLLISVVATVMLWNMAVGLTVWFGCLTAMLAALILLFAYYPGLAGKSAIASMTVSVIAAMGYFLMH